MCGIFSRLRRPSPVRRHGADFVPVIHSVDNLCSFAFTLSTPIYSHPQSMFNRNSRNFLELFET
jgi:hypothetical protein